jgi:hypothetical protein
VDVANDVSASHLDPLAATAWQAIANDPYAPYETYQGYMDHLARYPRALSTYALLQHYESRYNY